MANDPAHKAASTARDGGETGAILEPIVISEEGGARAEVEDLALQLLEKSTHLSSQLPTTLVDPVARAVRMMNCYYSNLIEDHITHPVDIERAMQRDYSANPEKRNLQLEAVAHITVQEWIDQGGLKQFDSIIAPGALLEIHRRFGELLTDSMLIAKNPNTGEEQVVEPGQFRTTDVAVGRHVAPSPGSVLRLLDYLAQTYERPGRMARLMAIGNVHHRLSHIHPFLDLNGRVMRMVSHAMTVEVFGSGGLWSVARGLALQESEYMRQLASADSPRQGDRDGRGTLSEGRLAGFSKFFLSTCIDQVDFMQSLLEPRVIEDRISRWAAEQVARGEILGKSDIILRRALLGDVRRDEVPDLLGVKERQARKITSRLLEFGVLESSSSKAPLKIALPQVVHQAWIPGL